MTHRPLLALFPRIASRVPWVELGELPTPVERLERLERRLGTTTELWAKRDDRSSPVYGGNKVRTLEVLLADARSRGAPRIWATGAYGTNHGLATVLHARRVGLEAGLLLFEQPASHCALENLLCSLGTGCAVQALPHWSALPWAMWRTSRTSPRDVVMEPGGAIPLGALGYVNAGLELATQAAAGALPWPARIVVGVGSTCTSAGLLVGLVLAERFGLVKATGPARLTSVRVAPWPVTSEFRILGLARQASELLARLSGEARARVDEATLAARFEVTGRYLGNGYGMPTARGRAAIDLFEPHAGFTLDTTYSGKSAAAVLSLARRGAPGPVLFWSTKSTAPLPHPRERPGGPARMQAWIDATARTLRRDPRYREALPTYLLARGAA